MERYRIEKCKIAIDISKILIEYEPIRVEDNNTYIYIVEIRLENDRRGEGRGGRGVIRISRTTWGGANGLLVNEINNQATKHPKHTDNNNNNNCSNNK